MKICIRCQFEQTEDNFPVRNDRSGRLRPYCKDCSNNEQRSRYEVYKRRNPFLHKCNRAKSRAKQLQVPFDLTPEYLAAYRDWETDRKSTRLNSSHSAKSRMPSSA